MKIINEERGTDKMIGLRKEIKISRNKMKNKRGLNNNIERSEK
jgi:hypothetical protein